MPEFVYYTLADGPNKGKVRPALVLDKEDDGALLYVFTSTSRDMVSSEVYATEGDGEGQYSTKHPDEKQDVTPTPTVPGVPVTSDHAVAATQADQSTVHDVPQGPSTGDVAVDEHPASGNPASTDVPGTKSSDGTVIGAPVNDPHA